MKRILVAVTLTVVFSGCASMRVKSRQLHVSLNQEQKANILRKQIGLVLENSNLRLSAVKAAPQETSRYADFGNLQPGDDMSDLSRENIRAGDLLLAVNGKVVPAETDVSARLASLREDARLAFYSPKDFKVKTYSFPSKELLEQLVFSQIPVEIGSAKVSSVTEGSWADRSGFKAGDQLVHGFFADGEGYKYLLLSLVPAFKSKVLYKGDVSFDNAGKAYDVFIRTFADRESLAGTEKYSLEKESFLKLSVISGDKFRIDTIHRRRFLGLGVHFNCPSDIKCGNVPAQVIQVFPNSEAERAGFEPKDLIEEIDGEPVEGSWQAIERIRAAPVGQEMTFKVRRGLKEVTIKAAKGLVVRE